MDLLVNEVMELEVVHVSDGYGVVEGLARSAVDEGGLAVLTVARVLERLEDIAFVSAVEYGSHNLPAERLCGVAEVNLENLTDVHTGRYAEGVEYDVERGAVGQEGHILHGQNAGHNALVAVAARHLVADADLALEREVDAHDLVDAGLQLVAAVGTGEYLYVDNSTLFAVGYAEGGISDLSRLFAEDCAEQSFLGGELCFALGSYLTYEDIASLYL